MAGALSRKASQAGLETFLVTSDKDYLQLLDDDVYVLLTKTGVTNTEKYTKEKLYEKYELTPEQFIDLKALMGDKSDNIPGVTGIGEKTALKFLHRYKSIDGIYENIDEIKGKIQEKLIEQKNQAYMSYELSKIVTHLPYAFEIDEILYRKPDENILKEIYEEYGFRQFIKRLDAESEQLTFGMPAQQFNDEKKEKRDVIECEAGKLAEILKNKDKIGIKILFNGERALYSEPESIGIVTEDNTVYFIDEINENILLKLKKYFEDHSIKKTGHNLKDEIIILQRYGIELNGISFDTMIGSYLLAPAESSYKISRLAFEYLGKDIKEFEDYLGSGKNKKTFSQIEKNSRKEFLADYLTTVIGIEEIINSQLMENDMDGLFYDMELPLVKIMASMEVTGFKIDTYTLKEIGKKLRKKLALLEEDIYQISGEKFNINSPKQLGEILFEKMNLPAIKKTKTGYSTNAEVLEKLKDKHPVIGRILEYRQYAKLNSTYVEGLLSVVDNKTGRIHSSFRQAVTATGRISSTEPNLQNIPVKTEEGKEFRKIFVAEEGCVLIDADYSQIELRVLAHLSKDKNLIEAFNNNEDIHTKTASQVFGVSPEQVTSLMRSRAKAVNFGIVYGISDYGLSRDLDISRKEAKQYIDNYLAYFSGVKEYMENIIKKGKKDGFVETVFGRRRYLPELKSRNFNVKAFGERLALNTPVRGTAADIIKKAMIEVVKEVEEKNYKSKLILQVHDELIIESPVDEKEEMKKILKGKMENAVKLIVPLTVDLNTGESWYDAK